MKIGHRRIAFLSSFIIAGFLFWPTAKNFTATVRIRRTPAYTATLTKYFHPKTYPPREMKFRAELSQSQRTRFLSLLDWDYFTLGKTFPENYLLIDQEFSGGGIPKDYIDFTPTSGQQDLSIRVFPEPGIAFLVLSGRFTARSSVSVFQNKWVALRDEIFPEARNYDFYGRKVHN